MQAGLLPLVDKGWLWRPRSGYERWTRIGPMMPGEHPVEMLAESLARAFDAKMVDIRKRLEADDELALAGWLCSRKHDDTAFLLAIDQFEELFTFADADERRRFDRLLTAALKDPDCPLFVISTVRSEFLDRFAEDLPQLLAVHNRVGRPWTLAPIGTDGLREVIDGPARLAGLDVSEVKDAMVAEARDEPGALPLVENALHYLWKQREGNRLSERLFTEQGGLAGILSRSADALLDGLGRLQRDKALKLLFRLVQVDPEGRRHTRRRMPLDEAITVAGGGESGRRLLNRLAGERAHESWTAEGPVRLITITEDAGKYIAGKYIPWGDGHWVDLIHERLIRREAAGRPQPYWPTLLTYIENNKELEAQGKLGALFGLFGLAEARDQIEKRRKVAIVLANEIRELERRERSMKDHILQKQKALEMLFVEANDLSPLVFLSYAREDASSVINLSKRLRENGFKTWVDKEDLLPGQKWKTAIQKTIRTADFLVLCMSRKSVTKRGFINVEQKWALETADHIPQDQIYLIPAKIEECTIPDSLLDYQCVDLYVEDGVDRLAEAITMEWAKRKGLMAP